jgi:hypothetical protein
MVRPIYAVFSLLLAACAASPSAKRPTNVPKPDVEVRFGDLFFGSGTSAPLPMDVFVRNGGAQAIAVRRIRVESPGMSQYGILPYERIYNTTIEPGRVENFALTPTALASSARMRPTEPLTLRVWIDFKAGEFRWREIYMLR